MRGSRGPFGPRRCKEEERGRPQPIYSDCRPPFRIPRLRPGQRRLTSMCPSLLLVLALAQHRLPLRRLPLHLPLTSSLGLGPLGVHLLLEQPLALLLGLGAVDL